MEKRVKKEGLQVIKDDVFEKGAKGCPSIQECGRKMDEDGGTRQKKVSKSY